MLVWSPLLSSPLFICNQWEIINLTVKVSSMSCLPACGRKEEEWWLVWLVCLVWSKYLLHKIAQIKLPAALSLSAAKKNINKADTLL